MFDKIKVLAANFLDTIHWRENRWTPQVAARVQPYASCFGHSVAWFLQNFGIKVTPDQVMVEVNSPKWVKEAERIVGKQATRKYAGKLNQLWSVMAAYCNTKLQENGISATVHFVDKMLTDVEIKRALRHAPVVCSIRPRYRGRILGHVVCIVGNRETEWIVDDPFGDLTLGYPNHFSGGDDIHVAHNELRKLFAGWFIVVERNI